MTFLFIIVIFCHHFCNDGINAQGEDARPRVAQFASMEVFTGQAVELPCTISATPATKVCWHVASDLAVSTGARYIQFCEDPERTSEQDGRHAIIADEKRGIYNLKIDPVIESDSGLYMCSIINELGIAVLFGTGRVSVVESIPPSGEPECKFSARADILTEGDMLSASCFAVKDGNPPGKPLSTLQWFDRNNFPISQVMDAHANQINWEVSGSDNGAIYKCIVHHIALESPRNCTVGPLHVVYKPVIKMIAKPSTRPKQGGNVTMICTAKGNPDISAISWYIEDTPLNDYQYTIDYTVTTKLHGTSKLTIYDLTDNQFNATITCVAENDQGQRNTSLKLTKPPDPPKYSNYNNLKTVLILDLVALALIVFFSVCVLGCWSSWRNLSRRIRAKCGCIPSAEPHHIPL